ncbi:hypothetical protein WCU81_06020 [Pectobacterium atrosepticum]|uniref:hypothetical protein n=1 Tax=Pectobacterium atrosepticum TaxID=29471 RepID=UPI00049B0DFB|nr:hypothetical protein [Pectobacterium atrosepticum]GKV86248.1 hypothetical protein PEC301296_25590 [Pectobacterium carotovorum subsp. carotovorum]AIA70033.1 hypothetical protein EV46_05400 [Pectobacterium atrosepticum]AIK12952.1 hypothetical protein GZ59_10960 [Pectobacterium atrosepticum]ATY89868.1 hypothetical protein CVS35_05600 [Pectobacterium atrosepticum]KFX16779.1 hypothetical protein JV34_02665 [Pectobacterium atrosepticum]
MNDQETEKELLANGFTQNDINFMRKIISRGEDSEETLQRLIHTLRTRFYNGCFLFVVIIAAFTINFIFNTRADLIEFFVYFFVMMLSLFLVYHIGPMKLAYKSYSYLKRKGKMG